MSEALTRRRLLAAAGIGAFGATSVAQAVRALDAAARTLAPRGALSPFDPAVRATMTAFADTIVPGPAGGGAPDPGAVEAGVVDEIYHPFYGVSDAYPVVHADLLVATPRVLGRSAAFTLELPYEDRERVLDDRIAQPAHGGQNPYAILYGAVAVLVYLGYYGHTQSPVGLEVIGLPEHSDGYHPRHSHRVRFKTMTAHGNPR